MSTYGRKRVQEGPVLKEVKKGAKGLGASAEDILIKIAEKIPIELAEQIKTLKKPLIIENACPGWQPKHWGPPSVYPHKKPKGYKKGGVRYPAVPVSIEDQAQANIEAIKAGAAALHIHPRDPEDGFATNDPKILKKVYDKIFEEVDAISIQHTWIITERGPIDYVSGMKELLKMGQGNKYCQGVVVLWPPGDTYPPEYARSAHEAVEFMEAKDIKPVHKLRSSYNARKMSRVLIDTGVITQKPYVLVHDMGHPRGWPMDMDDWMLDLVVSTRQTMQRMPKAVYGVFSGGRNWLPVTLAAILAGIDFVRVGIEDCYWMYPHKDELIQQNIDTVKKIVDFCQIIGREVADVKKARKILGIKRTAKT